jgi:SOS-response transcriptional repressor LexA
MSVYTQNWGQFMPPRPKSNGVKPIVPHGFKSFGDWLENLRLDADISPRQIEEQTSSYGLERRIERSYYERIESNQRQPEKVGPKRLEALRVVLKQNRDVWTERTGIECPTGARLEPENFNISISRITPEIRDSMQSAIRQFQDELSEPNYQPVYSSGAGGPFRDDEDPVEHVNFPRSITDRYPNALFMRVDGSCLEPDVPMGHYAVILPDAGLATAGSMVCIWFSDNGRKFAYLFESHEEGDHIIVQTNPPRTIVTPVGSVILGVVVDLYAPPSAPKLKARALYSIIAETAPHLLEN